MSNLPDSHPLLYLISNRQALRRSPEVTEAEARLLQIEIIHQATQAGCQMVQIREKDMDGEDLLDLTRAAIAAARPNGARILVNDRLDIAMAAGADGVHLRVSSISAAEARAMVESAGLSDFLIGVSTHSLPEARAAEDGGADFIVCGPVYETPSKSGYGPPLGIERFAEICRVIKIPTLALGGINLTNFPEPLKRGAAGIAAIGLFMDRQNIKRNVKTILQVEK